MYNTTKKLSGKVSISGDKSISHRLLMVGSIINDVSKIYNLSNCRDVLTTINCLKECNAKIKSFKNGELEIFGGNLKFPSKDLDCQNSGTSARLLVGLLAGQGITACFTGDISLENRPMKRIIDPLKKMGLKIKSNNNTLPLSIEKSILSPINYKVVTKSAQVKSALLFAALGSKSYSKIAYAPETRNHTEKLLKYLGYDINIENQISIKKSIINKGFKITVPGDISSASFLIAAAVLLPGSKISIEHVLYNKTRFKFIELLKKMNANISVENIHCSDFESSCTITASYSNNLKPLHLTASEVIGVIDEIPILSIVAAQCNGKTIFDGLEDLKYKESDRALLIYENLINMGADISYSNNRLILNGGNKLYNATIIHNNDHRIAMSFEILHLLLNNSVSMQYNNIIDISFPDFYSTIEGLIK